FFIYTHPDRLHTRSFTTRRSSDLEKRNVQQYTDDLPDWISYAPSNTWPPLKELDPNSFFFDFINKNMNQEMIEYISLYDDLQERSEEHTSELQSRFDIVCRLLLEK